MLSWRFLRQFNENNPPTISLGRKKEVEDKYSKFRENVKKKYGSTANYLEQTLFSKNEPFILKLNDFPYNTQSNIYHYLLWINPKYNSHFNNKNIKEKLDIFFGKNYIFFKNNTNNMSIKSIIHYHIFIRII